MCLVYNRTVRPNAACVSKFFQSSNSVSKHSRCKLSKTKKKYGNKSVVRENNTQPKASSMRPHTFGNLTLKNIPGICGFHDLKIQKLLRQKKKKKKEKRQKERKAGDLSTFRTPASFNVWIA